MKERFIICDICGKKCLEYSQRSHLEIEIKSNYPQSAVDVCGPCCKSFEQMSMLNLLIGWLK